jgi:hypothetical protein
VKLPAALLRADAALSAVQVRLQPSRHLNPLDEVEARARFLAGKPVRFTYQPLRNADELLRACDTIAPPAHPLGEQVRQATEDLRLGIQALRDRTPAAFDALAQASGWWEQGEAPEGPPPRTRTRDGRVLALPEVISGLTEALRTRGYPRWQVVGDPVMSARVLVDSPRRLVRVNPRASISPTDLQALIAHEIGVHVARAEAGDRQPLRIFATGLARSLATEEGLALRAEAAAVGLPAGTADRLVLLAAAARRAAEQGFTGLYRGLEPLVGAEGAWTTCVRLKRGLADPEGPGVYAKDRVYWLGWCAVHAYERAGGDRSHLAVGKVGVHHPVGEWLAEGWITRPG